MFFNYDISFLHDIQDIIGKTKAIARTIKLLSSNNSTDERHAAISFLLELSKSQLLLENIGSTPGSILILTTMKINSSDDPISAEKAGAVLKNLEKCPKNIKYMAESGYLDPLQRHLVEGKIWPLYTKKILSSVLGLHNAILCLPACLLIKL